MKNTLITRQWTDYSAKHRDRLNLAVHLVAVFLFQVSTIGLLVSVVQLSTRTALAAMSGLTASLLLQGVGHKREAAPPEPFTSPANFVSRLITEQWITFPRFVISGQWLRNFQGRES